MNDEELFEKIMNKELTICETCDNIFPYIPQKLFCGECKHEKIKARKRKYRGKNREKKAAYDRKRHEENREKVNARKRKLYEKYSKDPEWVEKINARQLARYHANKKQKKE